MSKIIRRTLLLMMLCILPLSMMGCTEQNYDYVATDPGQLKAPSVSRSDKEAFREAYPTLERYDETVTINVVVSSPTLEDDVKKGTTPQNQTFNEIALEKLNIKLNYLWIADPAMYDQKLSIYTSQGNVPDVFYTTDPKIYSTLAKQGLLADLSDVFWYLNDELQENYLEYFPQLLPTVMENGKLFALPNITNQYTSAQRLYIRQDWLDIVGMKAPKTMDEMYAVGKAFVDNADKIAAATGVARVVPFTMNKELTWTGSYSVEGFLNCYGTSINSYFEGSDGTLHYSNTSKEMKDALGMLQKMYQAGILDNEFLSKDTTQVSNYIKAGYVGMAFGEWFMPKDVLDDCIKNVPGSNWTWVDLPTAYEGQNSTPVVKKVNVSGYNLVSSKCQHPEAIAKLINLFYDIYYSDDNIERYGDRVLPSNGFYYQFVPVKLWDGVASNREYYRVQEVFNNLYTKGFDPRNIIAQSTYEQYGILEPVTSTTNDDYIVEVDEDNPNVKYIINRELLSAINANGEWREEFAKLKRREITLHFADGYPYFVAYKDGKAIKDMTEYERRGWGIYHEMIDETGGYAYVVQLSESFDVSTNSNPRVKFDQFYGSNLTAMADYLPYISKETNKIYTQVIKGAKSIDEFDSYYVNDVFYSYYGQTILDQVNQWYDAQKNINTDKVYALIKEADQA